MGVVSTQLDKRNACMMHGLSMWLSKSYIHWRHPSRHISRSPIRSEQCFFFIVDMVLALVINYEYI